MFFRLKNPFYLLSAFFMLYGAYLWNDPVSIVAGEVLRILPLYATLQFYEFCLIGIFGYLFSRHASISDCVQLLFLESLFLLDAVTTQTEFAAISPGMGFIINGLSLGLAGIKLSVISQTLRLKVGPSFQVFTAMSLAFLYCTTWAIVLFRHRFEHYGRVWYMIAFALAFLVHLLAVWANGKPQASSLLDSREGITTLPLLAGFGALAIFFCALHVHFFGYIFHLPTNIAWAGPLVISLAAFVGKGRLIRSFTILGHTERAGREEIVFYDKRLIHWVFRRRLVIETSFGEFSFPLPKSKYNSQHYKEPDHKRPSIQPVYPVFWLTLAGVLTVMFAGVLHRPVNTFFRIPGIDGVEITALQMILVYAGVVLLRQAWEYVLRRELMVGALFLSLPLAGHYPREMFDSMTSPEGLFLPVLLLNALLFLVLYWRFEVVTAFLVTGAMVVLAKTEDYFSWRPAEVLHVLIYAVMLSTPVLSARKARWTQIAGTTLVLLSMSLADIAPRVLFMMIDISLPIVLAAVWGQPSILALLGIPVAISGYSYGVQVLEAIGDTLYWLASFLGAAISAALSLVGRLLRGIFRALMPNSREQWALALTAGAFALLYAGLRSSLRTIGAKGRK